MTGKRHIVSKICFLSFFVILTFAFISGANAQGVTSSEMLSNIEKKTGIKLPPEYKTAFQNFIDNNPILQDQDVLEFTENFTEKEIKIDRGINKGNQLIFMLSEMFNQLTKTKNYYIYDGSDGDNDRLNEYSMVMAKAEECGQKYGEGLDLYLKELSADARQRSADARQRSADAIKEILKQDSIRIKERMVEFYNIYTQNPNNIKQDDLNFMKESTKEFVYSCKERGIDYRAILLKEVGDMKIVDAILKFYGIE